MTLLDVILYFVMPLAITALMTYGLIPYFHRKQFGQYIREEGPKAHLKKQGTPTMGGIAIFIGITAGMAIFMVRVSDPLKSWASPHLVRDAVAIVLTMLAFGAIGFIDDFNKIAKKENLGLTAKQKLIMAGRVQHRPGVLYDADRTGRPVHSVSEDRRKLWTSVHSVCNVRGNRHVQCGEPHRWTGWTGCRRDCHCGNYLCRHRMEGWRHHFDRQRNRGGRVH